MTDRNYFAFSQQVQIQKIDGILTIKQNSSSP